MQERSADARLVHQLCRWRRQPYWDYNITLQPGQTKIIANYVTGRVEGRRGHTGSSDCRLWSERAAVHVGDELAQVTTSLPSVTAAMSPIMLALLGLALAGAATIILGRQSISVDIE